MTDKMKLYEEILDAMLADLETLQDKKKFDGPVLQRWRQACAVGARTLADRFDSMDEVRNYWAIEKATSKAKAMAKSMPGFQGLPPQ